MYHLKPIITEFDIQYPTCMYKMKNIISDIKPSEIDGPAVSVTNSAINILDKRVNENIQTILKVFKVY